MILGLRIRSTVTHQVYCKTVATLGYLITNLIPRGRCLEVELDTAKRARVPSLDYLSETCWTHKISYKFPNYGIQKKLLVLKQFLNLEYLLLETLYFPIWKTWGKLYISVYSPKYVKFPTIGIPNSRIVYSTFKKLGRRHFFPQEICARKDNSVAAWELHVETN